MQTTGDGGFLLFSSYARLVAGDTDTAADVYRYDAQTEQLVRVSDGEGGYDANGNDNAFSAKIPHWYDGATLSNEHELTTRAISEDGSRIVFETAEPLSPDATNGLANAYEWHMEPGWSEGRVSLVSSGSDQEPVGVAEGGSTNIVITPSGKDIFFVTTQGLLPQDTDGVADIYDARLGEGFPAAPAPSRPCSGDACQGPLTNPAPLLVPGSISQAPGGNFAPPPTPAATVKPKQKSKSSACKRGHVKKKGRCVKKPKTRQTTIRRRAKR